jgi:hypothetical protein
LRVLVLYCETDLGAIVLGGGEGFERYEVVGRSARNGRH